MCKRAIQLKLYIDTWLAQEIARKEPANISNLATYSDTTEVNYRDLKTLRLSATEWHHIKLVATLLGKFKDATTHISQAKTPQVPFIWQMYNTLFDFLDEMSGDFIEDPGNNDGVDWPAVVLSAANRGKDKLSKYYSKTDEERGFIFNCATILDPSQKLSAYEVPLSQLLITYQY
jgi:hypothetical protein